MMPDRFRELKSVPDNLAILIETSPDIGDTARALAALYFDTVCIPPTPSLRQETNTTGPLPLSKPEPINTNTFTTREIIIGKETSNPLKTEAHISKGSFRHFIPGNPTILLAYGLYAAAENAHQFIFNIPNTNSCNLYAFREETFKGPFFKLETGLEYHGMDTSYRQEAIAKKILMKFCSDLITRDIHLDLSLLKVPPKKAKAQNIDAIQLPFLHS